MRYLLQAVLVLTLCLGPVVSSAGTDPAAGTDPHHLETTLLNQLSPEELKWYKTFQEGTFLITGWKEITRELLESTAEEQREAQARRLKLLGIKMGVEWSKDNEIRRVNNKMLQEWGKALKKTARKNPEQLYEVIVSIDQELDNILN